MAGRPAIRRAEALLEAGRKETGLLLLDGVALAPGPAHLMGGVCPAGFHAGTHQHEELQIEAALAGSFRFVADGVETPLDVGDALVIPPGRAHGWRCTEEGILLGAMLGIEGTRCDELAAHLERVLPQGLARVECAGLADETLRLLDAVSDGDRPPWGPERIGTAYRSWLMAVLAAAFPLGGWQRMATRGAGQGGADREEAVYARAMQFIEANWARPVQVGDVALHAGISARHLNRIFRKRRGETAGQRILQMRLQQARQLLLREPERPIKQIAFACGFNSPAYFAACYRRTFGHRPSEAAS